MLLYKDFKVHVLWQKSAWLSEAILRGHWVGCFEKDLERLNFHLVETLMLSDNLSAQKCEGYLAALRELLCRCVYGPKNGTDVWQPVDHGVGQRYQAIIAKFYLEWTRSQECAKLFRSKKGI